jgi:hypothetical protein
MSGSTTPPITPTPIPETRYRYLPVEQLIDSEELGTCITTYGISVSCFHGEELFLIPDISTDLEKIRQLANLLTKYNLYPEHLNDLIEDFLADEESVLA